MVRWWLGFLLFTIRLERDGSSLLVPATVTLPTLPTMKFHMNPLFFIKYNRSDRSDKHNPASVGANFRLLRW